MPDRRKIKALVLSVSLLALVIIIYRFSVNPAPVTDSGSHRTAASVVKEIVSATGNFFVDRVEDFKAYRQRKADEKAAKEAAKRAEEEARYFAQAASAEYIDSHLEGNTNVVEVKTEESFDEVVPETSLLTTDSGERFISMVDQGDAPNVAVYRYVRIPSEVNGVSFRPVNDVVYATTLVKLYDDPSCDGEASAAASSWEGFTRLGISKDCCYQLLTEDNRVLYADGTVFRRFRENMNLSENISMEEERVELPVKYICQNPTLPNGCEITSLATVLNYLGFSITKEKLSDDYLPKAPVGEANFFEEFVGNPKSRNSYGCYAPPIIQAANEYLESQGAALRAYDYTGSSFQQLLYKVREGKPVIVWSTIYINQDPEFTTEWIVDGEYLVWKGNLHCVVLTGYDTYQDKVIVSDPLRGITEYDMNTFIKRFKQFYSQAIVIE